MSDLVVLYERIMFAGFILAGVFFCAAVYLFFYFNIPRTVGLLSGTTRRREIEGIRSGAIKKENISEDEDSEQNSIIKNETKNSIQMHDKIVRETNDTVDLEQYQSGDTVELEQYAAFENGETADLEKVSAAVESNTVAKKEILSEKPIIKDFVVEQEITFIHTDERLN